jgi:hypothetical protein
MSFHIIKDVSVATVDAHEELRLPLLNIETPFLEPSATKGKLAYNTTSDDLYYTNGELWLPVSTPVSLASAGGVRSLVADGGVGPDLAIKGLTAGTGITLATDADSVTITATGASMGCSQFYGNAPADYGATIALNAPFIFPHDGYTSGGIVRSAPGVFTLPEIGTYKVSFVTSVTEAGQLQVFLEGIANIPNTTFGRATGTSQITGTFLVTTTVINSDLEIRNPPGNAAALTVTATAGGTVESTQSLIIERIA